MQGTFTNKKGGVKFFSISLICMFLVIAGSDTTFDQVIEKSDKLKFFWYNPTEEMGIWEKYLICFGELGTGAK